MNNNIINKSRTAFVFVEFQHEWLSEDGILQKNLIQDKEEFFLSVKNAEKIINIIRQYKLLIAHAGLDFSSDRQFLLFGKGYEKFGLRGAIPRAKTWDYKGSQFVEPFIPLKNEFIVKGRSGASVLKNSNLDPFLRNNDINTIILMGYATHICIESSLREAHDLGYNCYIVSDACAAFKHTQQQYFLENIVHHFGKKIDTESLINQLHSGLNLQK